MQNKLNVERIRQLTDHIEKLNEERFDMTNYLVPVEDRGEAQCLTDVRLKLKPRIKEGFCGTAGCIAGHAIMLFCDKEEVNNVLDQPLVYDPTQIAGDLLGLSPDDAWSLFMADGMDLERITRSEAVKVLKTLAQTGKIEWEWELSE